MLLNILAYIIIPVYTFLFAVGTDWFHENFSIIRNIGFRKWAFVLWGMILIFYFYLSMKDIVNSFPQRKLERFLSKISLCLLILTILTPYKPDVFSFYSALHVWFAFICPVFLMICILAIILQIGKGNRRLKQSFLWGFWGITAASAAFYFYSGMITSALEVFFVISCGILVRRLHRRASIGSF